MANERCIEAVMAQLKKSGKDFTQSEIKRIHDELNNLKSRVFSKGEDASSPEFMKKAMEMVQEYRFQAQQAKKKALMNLMTNQELLRFGTQEAFKGDPIEAIKAKLQGMTARYSEGGNHSVDGTRQAMRSELLQQLDIGLKKAGVESMMRNGSMDRDVMVELFHLRDGVASGASKNPDAANAAKVIAGVNSKIVERLQAAGSSIREVVGYITRQTHDREKIVGAGFDKWVQDILPHLDQDKTFGNMSVKEKLKMMDGIFQDIRDGKYRSNIEHDAADQFITTTGGLSPDIAKKTAQSRSLHFQDGNAFFEYNQNYGNKNLVESVMSSIEASSRNYALMNHLGTNPDGALGGWISRMRDHFRDAGDEESVSKLDSSKDTIRRLYESVNGMSDAPGQDLVAKTLRGARTWEAYSKLGNMFRSMHDWAGGAAAVSSFDGDSFFGHMSEMGKTYFNSFKSHAEREIWAHRLGIALEDIRNDMMAQYGSTDPQPGAWAKTFMATARDKFSLLSMMKQHFDSAKIATARQVSMSLADSAAKTFSELDPHTREGLKRYGIGEKDWSLLQRAVVDFGDGTKGMTPEGVKSIPSDLFLDGDKGKFELQDKVAQILNEHANIGSVTVGPREKAWMGRDEGVGSLIRTIGQFKNVVLMLGKMPARFLLSDPVNQPRNMMDVLRGNGGNYQLLAKYAATAMVVDMFGRTLLNAAHGKTAPDIKDPKEWVESVIRSGVGGIGADLLFGLHRDTAQAFLGPTVGSAFQGLDLARKAIHGDKVGRDAVNFAASNIPGQNLWFAKGAFDKYVMQNVQEMIKPGYKSRLEESAKKHGQSYFMFAPTSNNFLGTK